MSKLNPQHSLGRKTFSRHISYVKNGLQQGNASSPLVFTITLEYNIRSIQANHKGLKLDGTHQLLIYTDDVNILVSSIHTIQNNTEALVVSINPLPSLTLQSARDLNVPCWPKRSKVLLLSSL